MEQNVASSAMSLSLLARNVYCVCFTGRDSLDILRGELAVAREKYFTGGCKALRVGKHEIIRGFEGKLQGKLSRRGFYWRKAANQVAGTGRLMLEEAFDQRGGYVLVRRDFRNVITSRVFFDKSLIWLKSEYYEPWDARNARVIFKPVDQDDQMERFDWDTAKKRYRSTLLYPVPYLEGTAGQSLLNARFGEPKLLVSTQEGMFCYCPQKEAQARKEAMEELKGGTVMLLPAWEVKEGSLAGEDQEGPQISFTSLEEYAHIQEPEEPQAAPLTQAPVPPFQEAAEEFAPLEEPLETAHATEEPQTQEETQEPEPERAPAAEPEPKPEPESGADATPAEAQAPEEQPAPGPSPTAASPEHPLSRDPKDPESREILQAARKATLEKPVPQGPSYRGELREGKPWGRGRTEQPSGATSYEGGFRDGKREGFGAYYYKDGNLCYAGSWKNDKKDGLGVSFRDSDHALHIAQWKDGAPQEFVSLFDKDGNLRYGGRIQDGKKQGPGVSYNTADGTVFVGKWLDGQPTGIGSAFDKEGNLVYYGEWKNGKRHGHGTEFDSTGAIVFDGEWKDGNYFNGVLYQKRGQEALPGEEAAPSGQLPDWDL